MVGCTISKLEYVCKIFFFNFAYTNDINVGIYLSGNTATCIIKVKNC